MIILSNEYDHELQGKTDLFESYWILQAFYTDNQQWEHVCNSGGCSLGVKAIKMIGLTHVIA